MMCHSEDNKHPNGECARRCESNGEIPRDASPYIDIQGCALIRRRYAAECDPSLPDLQPDCGSGAVRCDFRTRHALATKSPSTLGAEASLPLPLMSYLPFFLRSPSQSSEELGRLTC
jgi:hypothetical protein